MPRVTVELYGIAARRAGREALAVEAETLSEALRELERACPALAGEVLRDGKPAPHWTTNLDGMRFVDEPTTPLADGARVLLLSSLAGG